MNLISGTLLLLSLTWISNVEAATHYIRAGATGTASGGDWTNAFTDLPAKLIRGDTYYVADGTYLAHSFNDPESGSLTINILKATASNHGTDLGWQATYGDGQAMFNSILRFTSGYYVFDGQTRNENNWFDEAAYGFQVFHNNQLNQNIVIGNNGGPAANNILIKHVYINAPYKNLPITQTIRQYAIDTDTYGGPQQTGLVFSRMYVRGSNNIWFLRSTTGAIVEYSASFGAASNGANHGEIVNLYYSGVNAIIRFNQFREAFIGNGGTAIVAITDGGSGTPGAGSGLQFYGNVVNHFQVGDASIGFDGAAKGFQTTHSRVYNNTFIDSVGYNAGTAWGGGADNLVYNNLFINCPSVGFDSGGTGSAHDYNGFSDTNARGESHALLSLSTSIFKNYGANDFTLAMATAPGIVLASPYNLDPLGALRGKDGTPDRGAYEFTSGQITPPPMILKAPTNLRLAQ